MLVIALSTTFSASGQPNPTTTVSGHVKNKNTLESVSAVSVTVKGGTAGTFTDDKGNYKLTTTEKLPFTLLFTSVGFDSVEVKITASSNSINVDLLPISALGQEIVISATRTSSRILESPVSIERVSAANIRNASAASYYDLVSHLKGVDVVTASLTFNTPTTRGFSASGNTRFNQLVNGMDNQAPGLNFSVGAINSLVELDVDNMELLPGASSALYGSGGMNGTLLITGKNPFKYQGVSVLYKQGIMHLGDKAERDPSPYYNVGVRWAQKLGDRFAFKVAAEYIKAQDWVANDYRNYKRSGATGTVIPGNRQSDPNYDGINVYGDETSFNIKNILNIIGQQAPFLAPYISTLPGSILVSRTGYNEKDIVDPNTYNLKLNGALHYKFSDRLEGSISANWTKGSSVYTGNGRYSLKDFNMGQYKVELTSKNWFLRAYTTQENAGQSFNVNVSTQLLNEGWKASTTWYPEYAQTWLAAKLAGASDAAAHSAARAQADIGRPEAGSTQFKKLLDSVSKIPIPNGGLFLDRSDMYAAEGQYNFNDRIKFAEVIVGANYKQYVLNSQGTVFADPPPIHINEYGAYAQISKDLVKDKLRASLSGRYDQATDFDGKFTPRITLLWKPSRDHNIRFSYQTAYRFPSNQQRWIDLDVGNGRLIGGVKQLWDKYNMTENPVYSKESIQNGTPEIVAYKAFKPESVSSFEVGYKSLINKRLLIDAYVYFSQYKDFLSRRDVAQKKDPNGPDSDLTDPSKINGISIVINAPGTVNANGWGLSLDYVLPDNFTVFGNLSSDELGSVAEGFRAQFNTPKYRSNLGFGNTGFGPEKRFGFSMTWRWQQGFFYDGDFASGDLPDVHTVDAQISYKFPSIKSVIKIGGNNVLNEYYYNGVGNAQIGGLYYISFGYNVY